MKKIFFQATFCLLVLCNGYTQSKSFISVKGKEIIGTDGKPFLIKGTNLGNWLVPEGYMFRFENTPSPRLINRSLTELIGPGETSIFWKKYLENYITEEDIHYLKSIGCNSLRIPFHYKLFTDEDYMGGKGIQRGFSIMDNLVRWCKKEGLYLILDMHCAPGGQTGDNIDDSWGYPFLFDDTASRKLFIEVWVKLAKRYRNETTILGYDLLNEPIAHFFDTAHFNPLLEPLYKEVTKAIRAVDKNHLIFLGGAQWNSNFSVFGKPFDDKLVYTFHKYWTATTFDVIKDYVAFSNKYQVPLYCGETGENTDEWVSKFRILLDENRIGWHFWPYKKMDNTRGFVDFARPAGFESVQAYSDSVKINFEHIRKLRPADMSNVRKSLDLFLENSKFKNCRPNPGYIQALGLKYKE